MSKEASEVLAFMRNRYSYDAETGLFRFIDGAKRGKIVGRSDGGKGYWRISIGGIHYAAHRLAWLCVNGFWPEFQIDHVNGIKSDNRIANLREASNSQNTMNQGLRVDNSTGHKGVFEDKRTGRFRARITIDGKSKNLGFYSTIELAAEARRGAAHLHGEFAREK